MIISCKEMKFDTTLSKDRLERALNIFSKAVIKRILCFALYLLGATRVSIAKQLEMPTESAKTLLKNIHHNGIPAFESLKKSAKIPARFLTLPGFSFATLLRSDISCARLNNSNF